MITWIYATVRNIGFFIAGASLFAFNLIGNSTEAQVMIEFGTSKDSASAGAIAITAVCVVVAHTCDICHGNYYVERKDDE